MIKVKVITKENAKCEACYSTEQLYKFQNHVLCRRCFKELLSESPLLNFTDFDWTEVINNQQS